MLKRIRLKDFKSFVNEEVEIAPLTLLVGANASGKSNFLDAIRFLQGLVFDLSLSEILNGERRPGAEGWPGIRGRAEEAARVGLGVFSIDTEWSVPGEAKNKARRVEVQHSIECRTQPHVALDYEGIEADQLWRYSRRTGGARSLLGTLSNGSQEDEELVYFQSILRDVLRKIQLLQITPSEMREYGRRGDPLGEDGHNISGVLAQLCDSPGEKQSLVDWLTELCAPDIENLDFLEIKELGDVMAMFIEKDGKRISARSVSDGTLHFLGTLLALRTAEPGSVFLIEEIEAGLHPTRIRLLAEYLETATREREIQVIATTHSPVLLQWLSDESLRNSIVFGRIPEQEGTIVRRIGDLPHFDEVLRRKGIDELFSTGWLEMAL
jgi:hypothetical protein